MSVHLTRRHAIKLGIAAGSGALLATLAGRESFAGDMVSAKLPPRFARPLPIPPLAEKVGTVNLGTNSVETSPYASTGVPRDVYDFTIQEGSVEILPGVATRAWGYNGISPGPTIRVTKGTETLIRFSNRLNKDSKGNEVYTSVHLHGMASLPQFDGWANDITRPGEYKRYIYPNNRGATLWYHDHAVHRTALNAYMGLAGTYIVDDPGLEAPGIPRQYGVDDIPFMLSDKIIDRAGQFVFDEDLINNSGLHGDIICVNGAPWPYMEVEPKEYRFRICNLGISRAYNLFLSNGANLQVIGADAGLLEKPVPIRRLKVGVGERYEVVIDFSKFAGQTFELRNGELDNHEMYQFTNRVAQFRVKPGRPATPRLPSKLRTDNFSFTARRQALLDMGRQQSGGIVKRVFDFERGNGLWQINGRIWGDGINPIEANPKLGAVEIWTFRNGSGGWNHPIHVHLIDFLMLERRRGKSPGVKEYEKGFKDVVYLGEGEEIDVITMFGPHEGKYMMHCHNLPHEDHDMMRAFQVGSGGTPPVGTVWDAKPIPQDGLPPLL